MKRYISNRIRPSIKRQSHLLFGCVLMLFCGTLNAQAQTLFTFYSQQPTLSAEQEHYLSAIKDQMLTPEIYFVNVDYTVIKQGTFAVADPYGKTSQFVGYKTNELRSGSFSIFGNTNDEGGFRSHFFLRKQFMRGDYMVDDRIYALRPIGDGMHVVYDLSDFKQEDCSDYNGSGRRTTPTDDNHVDHDLTYSEDGASRGGSPDCRVRLLCAYTTSVDALEADIQGYIENLVEYFNDANDNSQVPWHVELARSVEVAYSETETNEGSPTWRSTDLLRLQDDNDGWIDDVPVLRDLYDADMVLMFCDVVMGGSGTIGGQAFEIGATASEAYAVMRYNNTATSFPHEFAHLHGCRHHDDSETTPYAYGHGYANVADSWETLLSKHSCCDRIQNFSNPDVDWLGDATGTTAYYDNARVMEITGDDHHDFQSIVTNKSVWQDDIITVDEVADFQGATTLTNGTYSVDYQNGSTGTFRASSSITLSPGFWARNGSTFSASLESCANLRLAEPEDSNPSVSTEGTKDLQVELYPNPFNEGTTLNFFLDNDMEVYAVLSDALGRTERVLIPEGLKTTGWHSVEISGSNLAAGIYHVMIIANQQTVVRKIIKVRR